MNDIILDEKICRQCRGRCCQGHPGIWSQPERFFKIFSAAHIPSATQLAAALERFGLCLRDLGGVLIPAPVTTAAGCCFRDQAGCRLSINQRPCQCLALIPNLDTLLDDKIHCRLPAEFGSASARENWRPLQTLLQQVQTESQRSQQQGALFNQDPQVFPP